MHRVRGRVLILMGLVMAFLVGCGGASGGRLGVTGTVTYKGAPVDNGSIEFIPHPGVKTTSGSSITNGRFSIPADRGLEPGNYTIKISAMDAVVAGEPGGLPGKDPVEKIPAKYNSKSTLTEEVSPSKTKFDFKLD